MLTTKLQSIINIIAFVIVLLWRECTSQLLCPTNCSTCDSQSICSQCNDGFYYLSQSNTCNYICTNGQYYDPLSKNCVSICPNSYYNQDSSSSCVRFPECPSLNELGQKYFDVFTSIAQTNGQLYSSGTNTASSDYTIKIFDINNNCDFLGFLKGHLSEIVAIKQFQSNTIVTDQNNQKNTLFSLGINELIEWDLNQGKLKQMVEFKDSFQASSISYFDEKVVILQYNETYFGALKYTEYLKNTNQFNNYFTLYQVTHLNSILGYLKSSNDTLFSFSKSELIQYDQAAKAYELCSFELDIKKVYSVNSNLIIILFSSSQNLQIHYRYECTDLIIQQNQVINSLFVIDQSENIILVQFQTLIKLYRVLEYDSQSSGMYTDDLQSITNTSQIIYLNVYQFDEVQSINNYTYSQYLVILYKSGILQIHSIADSDQSGEIPSNMWLVKQNQIAIQIQSLSQVNNILIQKELGNIILLGQGLNLLKVNFSSNQVINRIVKKNISQTKKKHTDKVTGIVGDSNQDRVISFSQDGSFIIWQESVDSFSGMPKVRFVYQQYHPSCNQDGLTYCLYPVQSLELALNNLIIVTYKSDNNVYLFNYQYDSIWLNYTYSLTLPTLTLNNYHFLKKNQTLTLCNSNEIGVFNISTTQRILTKTMTTMPFYYGILEFQQTLFGSYLGNYFVYVLKQNSTYFWLKADTYPKNQNQQNFSILKAIDRIFYIEDTTALVIVTSNYKYLMEYDFYIYSTVVSTPSAISYEPVSRNLIVFQKNLKIVYMQRTIISYNALKSFTFSAMVDPSAVSTASTPEMYFFYQNTPVEQLKNQIYAMGPNLDVQMLVSFENKISSLVAVQKSQKIYVGFENGDIQSGYFNTNYLQAMLNVFSPSFSFSSVLNTVYYFDKDIRYTQLITNVTASVITGQTAPLNGLLIDETNNNIIAYAHNSATFNFFIYDSKTNLRKANIIGGNTQGTTLAFLDKTQGYLLSYYNGTNEFFVWTYPNLTFQYNCQDHISIYNDLNSGNDASNSIVYTIGYIFLNLNQNMIISTNNFGGVHRYYYMNNTSSYTTFEVFSKVYFDSQQNVLYISEASQISYASLKIYDTLTLSQQYVNSNSYFKDIAGLVFQGNKVYIYDSNTLNVCDRVTYQIKLTITSTNPTFQSIIVSDKLNYLFVWNNQQVNRNSNIAIYSLVDGSSVFMISSYQQIESGSIDTVVLDEDSYQLYITKDTNFYLFSFDLTMFQYSGYYLIGYDTAIVQMQFIPALNTLIVLDASRIRFIKSETSINTRNNFRSIYSTMNDDQFQNNKTNKTYLIDRQNAAWEFDYQNFNQKFLFELDLIRLTYQYNDRIYIVLNSTLFQYNTNFDLLYTQTGRFKNLWFDSQYIFAELVSKQLIILSQSDLSQITTFITQFTAFIQKLIVIEEYKEVIILLQNSEIQHYSYVQGVKINQFTPSSVVNSIDFDQNKKTLIHILDTSIQFYTNFTPNKVNYKASTYYTYTSALTNTIRNLQFDYSNNQMFILFQTLPYLVALNYTYDTTNIYQLKAFTTISNIPLPSRTPDIMLHINSNDIQIISPWSIIRVQKVTLKIINSFRDNTYLKSITAYYTSIDQPQYTLVSSDEQLILLIKVASTEQQSVLYKLQIPYPKIISFEVQKQDSEYKFNIKGTSDSIFFYYFFYLSPEITSISSSNSLMLSQCYLNGGEIKYSYNQQNKLIDLQNSLQKLSINLKQSLLYVDPSYQFYLTDFNILNKDYKVIYNNDDSSNSKRLNLTSDSFSDNSLKHLQISNYIFDILNTNEIGFNDATQRITFHNIQLQGNTNRFSLVMKNQDYLVIENFIIEDSLFLNSTLLFLVKNCSVVYMNNITIRNIQLFDNSTLFQFVDSKRIWINNLTIENISIDQNSFTNQIILLLNIQQIQIENSNFRNIISLNYKNQSNFILSEGASYLNINHVSYFNIQHIPFINSINTFKSGEFLFLKKENYLTISNLVVDSVKNLSSSAITYQGYSLGINNSNFLNIDCLSCLGGAINTQIVTLFSINTTTFSNVKALSGGAVAIFNSYYNLTIFKDCIFDSNSASASGGAIYLESSDLDLYNSFFSNNQALIGGAIRYINIEPLFVFTLRSGSSALKNNTFTGNQGTIHSDNYGSYTYSVSAQTSNAKMSEVQLRSRFLTEESARDKYVIKQYNIQDFQSGGTIDLNFQIQDREGSSIAFDLGMFNNDEYDDSILKEISSLVIKATVDDENIKLFGQQITNYQQFNKSSQSFLIKELNIVSLPLTQNIVYIEVPSIKRMIKNNINDRSFDDGPFLIKLVFSFRNCEIGEIYKESNGLYICSECKEGFYSLSEPIQNKTFTQTCSRCPDQASYCYKNNITLKEGYWRIDNNTDSIVECSNFPLNCNGNQTTGYCKEGHYGPLCENCDSKGVVWGTSYMSDGKYGCVKCSELQNNAQFILPSIIVGVLMVIYMIFSIRIAIDISENIVLGYYLRRLGLLSINKSAFLDTTNINMKAMMNYMQIAQLINTFQVDLPEFLKILPEYLGSPINNFMFTFDCYLNQIASQQIPLIFLRTIWSLVMPFMYIFGMSLVYFVLIQLKWVRHNKSHLVSGLVFLIYFLQPNMVSHLLSVMACRKIDGRKYILADIGYICQDDIHVRYIFCICLPALLLWAVILPGLMVRKLYVFRNNLDNALVRIPFGFLYQDYKQKYFYWEFIRSYLKIAIIIILNFYGDPYRCILFLFYIIILQRAQPYNMIYFQNTDKRSMVVLIVIILMNIFLYNKPDIVQQQIFYIIVLGIHNCYQLFLVFEVVRAKFSIIFKFKINNIKKLILQYFPKMEKYIKIENQKTLKIFTYWKLVRKEIIEMKKKRSDYGKSLQQNISSPQYLMTPSQSMLILNEQSKNISGNMLSRFDLDIQSFRSPRQLVLHSSDKLFSPQSHPITKSNQMLDTKNQNLLMSSMSPRLDQQLLNSIQGIEEEQFDTRIFQKKRTFESKHIPYNNFGGVIYKNLKKVANEENQVSINIIASDENKQTIRLTQKSLQYQLFQSQKRISHSENVKEIDQSQIANSKELEQQLGQEQNETQKVYKKIITIEKYNTVKNYRDQQSDYIEQKSPSFPSIKQTADSYKGNGSIQSYSEDKSSDLSKMSNSS